METENQRKDGILVFTLSGRFDAGGADTFESEIKKHLHADDRSVVIDMEGVPYLSSGGIRVLIALKKEMKKRDGNLIISSLQDYPAKVLDMAGLLAFFKTSNSLSGALETAGKDTGDLSLLSGIKKPSTIRRGIKYTFEQGVRTKGVISVKGDAGRVLRSDLKENDIFEEYFDDCYQTGLGSMGTDKADASGRLGEMINICGTMAWFPTDTSKTPDFFTPLKKSNDVVFYSGLSISTASLFNDIITMEAGDDFGITLEALYDDIFSFAYERQKECRGLIFIVIWGVSGALYGSRIKKTPIHQNRPHTGGLITDWNNFHEWFDVLKEPGYQNETVLLTGLIADTKNPAIEGYDISAIKSAFYPYPPADAGQNILSQIHGAVIKNLLWDIDADPAKIAKQISQTGEITDIRHLFSNTILKKAKIGVIYADRITHKEDQD